MVRLSNNQAWKVTEMVEQSASNPASDRCLRRDEFSETIQMSTQ